MFKSVPRKNKVLNAFLKIITKKRCAFFSLISHSPHKRIKFDLHSAVTFRREVGKLIIFIGLVFLAVPAYANEKTLHRFEIAEQDLIRSVHDISNQTQTLILFPYALVEGRKGSAISGQYSTLDALNAVLKHTGLIALPSQTGALTISKETLSQLNNIRGREMNTKNYFGSYDWVFSGR